MAALFSYAFPAPRSSPAPPRHSDRPPTIATAAACSPPSTTSSRSSPSRLSHLHRRRVNLCERHKETPVMTCSSPQLPNDDDSSIEMYVCSHGNGHHNHHHHNHQ